MPHTVAESKLMARVAPTPSPWTEGVREMMKVTTSIMETAEEGEGGGFVI